MDIKIGTHTLTARNNGHVRLNGRRVTSDNDHMERALHMLLTSLVKTAGGEVDLSAYDEPPQPHGAPLDPPEPAELNTSERHINPEIQALLQANMADAAFNGTLLEGQPRRYTVINERDVERYLTDHEQRKLRDALSEALGQIESARKWDQKHGSNTYLVINTDEPYAENVVDLMAQYGHGPKKEDT